MTISSLAKIIVGVNRMVVENVEIEYPEVTIHGKKILTHAAAPLARMSGVRFGYR